LEDIPEIRIQQMARAFNASAACQFDHAVCGSILQSSVDTINPQILGEAWHGAAEGEPTANELASYDPITSGCLTRLPG
jgi:hypothetical protein